MANVTPDTTTKKFADGTFDWDAGGQTYKAVLATSSYTPVVGHDFANDITNELSGGNYARQTVGGRTATLDAGNHRTDLIADNVSFGNLQAAAGTPKWLIIIKDNGGADSANEIVWILDLGTLSAPDGSEFVIKFNSGASSGAVGRIAA